MAGQEMAKVETAKSSAIKIDPASLDIVAFGTLKTTGKGYFIGFLNHRHLPAIKAFHDFITDSLTAEEKSYLLQKPFDHFAKHLAKGDGNAIIAVIGEDGEMIAQSLIVHPTAAHPATGMVDMAPVAPPEQVSVLQSVAVLPTCRGNGIMQEMVKNWLDHAHACGREHAISEIEVGNIASWNAFLKEGINLVGLGVDPADGTKVYNAHESVSEAIAKRLRPVFNACAMQNLTKVPASEVEWHDRLFKAGQKCIGYDKTQKALLFETGKEFGASIPAPAI